MENQKLNDVLAQIKKGTCSMYSAKQKMGDELTPEIEAILRKATDEAMDDVCKHQDKMQRVMRRGF